MDIDSITNRYTAALERDLRAAIPPLAGCPGALTAFYTMLHYHLGWVEASGRPVKHGGGKRIRPVICLLACEAAGGDYRLALPVATAVELLHNFTLIHDDIQDCSVERRHRPTVWKIWGEAQAINAGDGMYALTQLALFRLAELDVPASFINEAAAELNRTLFALAEGQFLDMSFEQRLDVTVDQYLAMIERKTGMLIGAAAWLGAYLASADRELAEHYRMFGHALGIAFQIQDDILGVWGDPKSTGKPAGDDIFQKKKTLPLVFALQTAGAEQLRRLHEIYAAERISKAQTEAVAGLLKRLGAKEYAEDKAKAAHEDALLHLNEAAPLVEAGENLRNLASALLNRNR
ncbi:MAG: polyprenyl synthetase family protein [Chloroflexi bacterium]|nr:polyprenyl synthetase family protein [Chloroflexota bacterium]